MIPGARYKLPVIPWLIFVLLITSLACSLPGLIPNSANQSGSPTLMASATPPPPSLPPALVESSPPPGAELPLESDVTMYFNQPMDQLSVEAAITTGSSIGGKLTWVGDSTLVFQPDSALPPETDLVLAINQNAKARNGLSMLRPVELRYRTAGFLRTAQLLPEPGAADIDPSSAVILAFNRPVAPLGPAAANFPAGFTLEPAANGTGEWVNTSTYAFYPAPALSGGQTYTVRINPDLRSTDGGPLQDIPSWSFSTALPRLLSAKPDNAAEGVPLDARIELVFNQPMDPASTLSAFRLLDPSGLAVAGIPGWNADFTTFFYTPTNQLGRGLGFTVQLDGSARSGGGTSLGGFSSNSWRTIGNLTLIGQSIQNNGFLAMYNNITMNFNAPLQSEALENIIQINPKVENLGLYADPENNLLYINASFEPATRYTLSLPGDIRDRWGGSLSNPVEISFTTGDLYPSLIYPAGGGTFFLRPQDTSFEVQSINIFDSPAAFGSISLADYLRIFGPDGYQFMNSYQAPNAQRWTVSLNDQRNLAQTSRIEFALDNSVLTPGLYWLKMEPRETTGAQSAFMVVSNVQMTFKISASDVLVWAVDLRNQLPVPGVPVVIYADDGTALATGFTDGEGVFTSGIPFQSDPYRTYMAVLSQPGSDAFSLATSAWNQGISGYDFGMPVSRNRDQDFVYLYTDRPIYRPGDTIYFRVVTRQAQNGRYALPVDLPSLPVKIIDWQGTQLAAMDLPMSGYGSGHSQYKLFAGAAPGYYQIQAGDTLISFQVADYRKPEINVSAAFAQENVIYGQPLQADINARYFFDAPASGVKVHWALYAQTDYFYAPNYQVGPRDDGWLKAWNMPRIHSLYGALLKEGDAQTDANGKASFNLPTDANPEIISAQQRQEYVLEVTLTDESGQPVSTRATAWVHPAAFYIGVQPDTWSGQAGTSASYTIQTLDHSGKPAGAHALHADFSLVKWERQDPTDLLSGQPAFTAIYTPKGSKDFSTDAAGSAHLEFNPDEPGVYQLSIHGEKALTEILIWVNGPGEITWPEIPNQRLQITADKSSYKPGDTASLFIPNPFPGPAVGLLTIERGIVMRHQVINLPAGGANIAVKLQAEDSPNVFAAVTILTNNGDQSQPDFRQGYVNLAVDPAGELLKVDLSVNPQNASPGEEVTISLKAADAAGKPVQAEFSLSVIDKAVLALADPNSSPIEQAFYGPQGLSVRTGVSLAAYIYRTAFSAGGLGGGGGDMPAPVVRDDFPDTALWEGALVTDANGSASVSLTLPDTLTTWQVEARGLTTDSRVGQALTEIITSKELLVRPVTPRFMVAGDHVRLGAVVQNNTSTSLPVTVSIQPGGFDLDVKEQTVQVVDVPAFGRVRVNWWGTVRDVSALDLLFSARAGDLVDMVRPASGRLPVLHYAAAQAFATSGVLESAGLQLELVSLPVSYPASANPGDELRIELAPSLAAAMIGSLGARPAGLAFCTEQVVSSFLPNLETYRLLEGFGFQSTTTQADLSANIRTGLQDILNIQQSDGGWAWWSESAASEPYMTAYALFALLHARQAGMSIPDTSISRAVDYLNATLSYPETLTEGWQLDQIAFIQYVLGEAGSLDPNSLNALYNQRGLMAPWSRAMLALAFDRALPGSQESLTLFSDLQSQAQVTALGASWQQTSLARQNMHGEISSSAVVAFALAQHDPAAPLLTQAVRFLMANRRAERTWSGSFSAAWALLAINGFIKGTGDLNADFNFSASLNGEALLNGQAGGDTRLSPVNSVLPATRLYPGAPNALAVERSEGPGRLYYSVSLEVSEPAASAAPLNAGFAIDRQYILKQAACPESGCPAVDRAQVGQALTVQVNLTIPTDMYHVRLEDYIPAGAEILDLSLNTAQSGLGGQAVDGPSYDPRKPFLRGWAWWAFNKPEIYRDHIAWTAAFLPAGAYQITYTLNLLQAGEFQVLPARAYQMYFPDVQGNSAGSLFTILP